MKEKTQFAVRVLESPSRVLDIRKGSVKWADMGLSHIFKSLAHTAGIKVIMCWH